MTVPDAKRGIMRLAVTGSNPSIKFRKTAHDHNAPNANPVAVDTAPYIAAATWEFCIKELPEESGC